LYICSRYQPGGRVPAHKELLAEEARQLEIFRSAINPSQLSKATSDMIKCKVAINTNIYDDISLKALRATTRTP
jgi:hypothetical protein